MFLEILFIEVLSTSKALPNYFKNTSDHLSGFLQGTRSALTESNRQSISITITQLNEHTLGALLSLFEKTVSIYAELININAYHQPGVEAGKKAASSVLKTQNEIELLLSDTKERTINDIKNNLTSTSAETIYWIIRHLIHSQNLYSYNGDLGKPSSIKIRANR